MKRTACIVAACLLLTVSGCSKPPDLVGKWEVTKSDEGMPPGSTVEFTKDGKTIMSVTVAGQTITMNGTYKRDGDKIIATMKDAAGKEQSETITINSLTDKELVATDSKGKKATLTRK